MIRKVRGGERIVTDYYGKPVAEIVPMAPAAQPFAARVAAMERAGMITVAPGGCSYQPITRRPGSLKRFVEERA